MEGKKYVAYVGTYTRGIKNGLNVYDVDVENGVLIERNQVEVSNSSHISVSKNGKYLYSIENEGVAVFDRDAENGDLTRINSVKIDGMRGCWLATDVSGHYLYVAGYHDGKVTVVHTHQDGRLGSIFDGVYHKGLGSVAERNFRPHVNCVRPTPDNKYLCAVDNGIDQVKIYRINTLRNKLDPVDVLRCPRESAPRMIRFSDDGRFAYILFEIENVIRVYTYDGSGKLPEFELIQTISTLSSKDKILNKNSASSGMTMRRDGEYLFCSTAGEDTVCMFKRDPETGMLERKFCLPVSGEYPKDIALFPDGNHLAVLNHESGTITTFKIDYEKNLMYMHGKPHKVPEPNTMCILEVPKDWSSTSRGRS